MINEKFNPFIKFKLLKWEYLAFFLIIEKWIHFSRNILNIY